MVNRYKILAIGRSMIGKTKYLYGAKALPPGIPPVLDCSGFVRYVFVAAGEPANNVPDGTSVQWSASHPIRKEYLLPGDLGFLQEPGKKGINHIGIYTDRGTWLHCSYSKKGVVEEKTTMFKHYRRFFTIEFEKEEEEENMIVSEKEKSYGKAAIENLHKNGIITSMDQHISELSGSMPAWKVWVLMNNIFEKMKGEK